MSLVADDERIVTLFVWIATEQDGAEWIVSRDIPLFNTTRYVPLMSTSRDTAETLEPLAKEALKRLPRKIGLRLVEFAARRV